MPKHFSQDPRVVAVRNDPQVGRGTASATDETMTDRELFEEFEELGIKTPRQALRHVKQIEDIFNERVQAARNEAF